MQREPARARSAPSGHVSAPSVLAVVVTHHGRAWLKDCLVSLNSQTYPLLDVLVIDDASSDTRIQPHLKRVAKRHLRKRRWGYLRTRRPLGFGGAINWALSRVRTDADLLLFIHDDAALDRFAVARMVENISKDPRTAIVGPKVVAWDNPDKLEEVGMATDRFGFPYKGLEDNEIDLGQHDVASEVFYVTSTCMLMRHEVFKKLRGWDARMRAFSEDLDLCWRARLAGYNVRVEPAARARHAIALARDLRRSPFRPARYYIRRNRLRTVWKNTDGARLLFMIPASLVLTLFETIAFLVLREPRDAAGLVRAIGWNLVSLPQTLADRARIPRAKEVRDHDLRRLMVRQTTRIRFYVTHQAERLEAAWGQRAELVQSRTRQAQALARSLRGVAGAVAAVVLIALVLGFRNILFEPPAVMGELLPFPESATGMWRAFFSPWRNASLGEPGPVPPALAILGFFPLLAVGGAGVAQKLLILGLGGVAFVGAYSLVKDLVDRPSRLASGLAYALGPFSFAAVQDGALGALVFGATAPFAVLSLTRLIGWMRPPGWNRGRAVARVAVTAAISAAFVPGSLVMYAILTVLLAATRTFLDRGTHIGRAITSCAIGLISGWALLLPWSATWFSDGGAFERLTGDTTWQDYAAGFGGHGVASVVLAQTPDGPALLGLGLAVLGLVAVVVGDGQRRKLALALWVVIAAVAWLVGAFASGALRPFVASPTEAGVLSAVAFAALAGLAVGAFRLDLPRRGLGLVHALTLGGMAVAAFLLAAGAGPAVVAGAWDPGRGSDRMQREVTAQITDLLEIATQAPADTSDDADGDFGSAPQGVFRTLWVGDGWSPPTGSASRPAGRYMVTGARGPSLTDLFERRSGEAHRELHKVIGSIEAEMTDLGGRLLGAFNIAYVVVERGDHTSPWLEQRDLAVIRSEKEYFLLSNEAEIARAAVYSDVPPALASLAQDAPSLLLEGEPEGRTKLEQRTPSRYTIENAEPGAVVLAEAADDRWVATADDQRLERLDAGWANAFDAPSGGDITVRYTRSTSEIVWLVVIGMAWLVVLAAAFARSRPDALRGSR